MSVEVKLGDCLEVMAEMIAAGVTVDAVVTDPPYHLTSIVKRFGGKGAAAVKKSRKENATGVYQRASKGFLGQQWDGGDIAFRPKTWSMVLDLLKPGGYVLAFSATRTYHRMACAIEDAGFEIRDQIGWLYGCGFSKSHDLAKAIDKAAGHWRGRAWSAIKDDKKRAFGQHYQRTEKGDPITATAAAWNGWGTALKPAWEPIVMARKPLACGTIAANVGVQPPLSCDKSW